MPKDGNCLFSSLAHQLFGKEINSAAHETATNNLRASVVKHIQQNYDDFYYEIRGHVYDLKDSDENHEIHKFDKIEDACEYLLTEYLTQPGNWGGAETLKAIASMHNVNIIVFNENGPVHAIICEQQNERCLIVVFRLKHGEKIIRNHYDSACNMSADCIYKTAKVITQKPSLNETDVSFSVTLN